MIEAWRIVKASQAAGAFSGEGARRYGGRWNSPGTSCVYLADSLPLAAMEIFLHLGRDGFNISFAHFQVLIPEATVRGVDLADLPRGWRTSPPGALSMAVGTLWAKSRASAVLKVPSALMPLGRGFNYILNPAHADFPQIILQGPEPFNFDPRMWK